MGDTDIGMPQSPPLGDIISAVGNSEEIRKIKKIKRSTQETLNNSEYDPKKTKIMVVRKGKEEVSVAST